MIRTRMRGARVRALVLAAIVGVVEVADVTGSGETAARMWLGISAAVGAALSASIGMSYRARHGVHPRPVEGGFRENFARALPWGLFGGYGMILLLEVSRSAADYVAGAAMGFLAVAVFVWPDALLQGRFRTGAKRERSDTVRPP